LNITRKGLEEKAKFKSISGMEMTIIGMKNKSLMDSSLMMEAEKIIQDSSIF
jgi:hypothetical protein